MTDIADARIEFASGRITEDDLLPIYLDYGRRLAFYDPETDWFLCLLCEENDWMPNGYEYTIAHGYGEMRYNITTNEEFIHIDWSIELEHRHIDAVDQFNALISKYEGIPRTTSG